MEEGRQMEGGGSGGVTLIEQHSQTETGTRGILQHIIIRKRGKEKRECPYECSGRGARRATSGKDEVGEGGDRAKQ